MDSNRYPKKCYGMLKRLAEHRCITSVNWVYNVQSLLFHLGFGHVWLNQGVGSASLFLSEFKQRVRDCAIQTWNANISLSSKLRTYKNFKTLLEHEMYLNCVNIQKFRIALSRFRCSSHDLCIETGRHENVPAEHRFCKYCIPSVVEDEYHFLAICPHYNDLRTRHLPEWFRINPSYDKFISLLSSKNAVCLNQLAVFIYFAMESRI